MIRAIIWGSAVTLFLQFGLEPMGWLFYELSHATGIDGFYYGYTLFRGGGYMFQLWPWHLAASLAAGALVAMLVMGRSRRRQAA